MERTLAPLNIVFWSGVSQQIIEKYATFVEAVVLRMQKYNAGGRVRIVSHHHLQADFRCEHHATGDFSILVLFLTMRTCGVETVL
jgi:hypothetical protein